MMTDTHCPVWCNGEHAADIHRGWFHDSSRDVFEVAAGGDPVSVGVSRYVNDDGTVDRDMVELRATTSDRMTPSEARQFADMLYIAADMAETTTVVPPD